MGSAVSSVTSALGMGGGNMPGIPNNMQELLSPSTMGSRDMQDLIERLIPAVPIANQTALNDQIAAQQSLANSFAYHQQDQQATANTQLRNIAPAISAGQSAIGNAQNTLGLSQQALGQNQGAINNAQGSVNQANQGLQTIGQPALNTLQSAALGNAPSAAQAQLQVGLDAATRQQQAMANSGNLSQAISGQKAAMDNAALLSQGTANQAAQLRANEMATARGQYGQQALGQEGAVQAQAALQQAQTQAQMQAAGQQQQQAQLQQAQTAAQQAQTAQQQQLLSELNNQAMGYGSQANQAQQGAMTGETNALGIEQGALGQTAQYRAQALGGMMNAGGGAIGAMAASDENLKTNIKPIDSSNFSKDDIADISSSFGKIGSTPMNNWEIIPQKLSSDESKKKNIKSSNLIDAFLDALDPVSFEYKNPTGDMGQTPGTHMGIIAQQVEKAPGGKSMVVDTAVGKGIDLASAVGTLLAAAAQNHDKVKELEELYKSRDKSKRKK